MVNAEKLLGDLLETVAKDQNYEHHKVELKEASSGNGNYTTKLYVATISAPNKDNLKLFGKVAVFSEELRKTALSKYYVTERMFFTKLAKRYDEIQDKHNIVGDDRLVLPKFYGINENYMEETLLFEDLGASGFVICDRFKSVNWNYAAKTVEELAKLHALSIAYGLEYPEEFSKLLVDLKFEIPAEREAFRKLCAGWFAGALEVTKEEYKERFTKFMEKYGDMEETTQFYSPIKRAAITHGDFKITNLLHKVCDNGAYKIAILDYQTLRAGSMVSDLIYFIFTSTDQEFRRQYYHQLVEHYYVALRAAFRRLGVGEDVYPREDFDYEMKTVLPFGLTVAVYVLLVLLVTDADALAVSGGVALDAFAMRPSKLYGERLNGILEDCISWGIL